MRNYEVTFIVDPVLSGDEIKKTAQSYKNLLTEDSEIVHIDEMGLKQLAYPLNKRSSGIYYCIEFTSTNPTVIPKLELALRRDERIIRFLSIKLDKYGVKYNEDNRNGLIGKKKNTVEKAEAVSKPETPAPVPTKASTVTEKTVAVAPESSQPISESSPTASSEEE